MSASTLSVQNVSHSFGNTKPALSGIQLEMQTGLYGLLGANGAGKTTLMRIIGSLLSPSEGQVCYNDRDIHLDPLQFRRRLGYLPQEFGAWRSQRVDEVLHTLARFSGLRNHNARSQRVEHMLAKVGLQEVSQRRVKQLSGGMLRRLGIAQALIHDPDIVILDEATIGLDPEERLRFKQLVSEMSREKIVLLSTHIISDLSSHCNRLFIIHEGALEFDASPQALKDKALGSVFELKVAADVSAELAQHSQVTVVSRVSQTDGHVFRIVTPPGADLSEWQGQLKLAELSPAEDVSMEEAYMAFGLAQGRLKP